MTFLFSFTECNLLCWCCHATATAPIPPKSHPLSFLDLSVSGVACRLHTQKRLQVCGYTTCIMEGNAKHSTTYHHFRYCSCCASSSSQFCTTSHWNKDNYSKQNWWFLLAATLNMSELRCLKLILNRKSFLHHFCMSFSSKPLGSSAENDTDRGGNSAANRASAEKHIKVVLGRLGSSRFRSEDWLFWKDKFWGNKLTYATSNMPWVGICELCRRGNI